MQKSFLLHKCILCLMLLRNAVIQIYIIFLQPLSVFLVSLHPHINLIRICRE